MSVWFVLPARRNVEESTIPRWIERGYRVAIVREISLPEVPCDLYLPCRAYPGWARSVNALIASIMMRDRDADWFVLGGDDTLPDPIKSPEEIGKECDEVGLKWHRENCEGFGQGLSSEDRMRAHEYREKSRTSGVMQPTGDRRRDSQGVIIERVAGSPWIGREFARRMYGGSGPLYNGWFHNWADQELQEVETKLGVFWQRPDVTHEHLHWAYKRGSREDMPAWAAPIYSAEQWRKDKALFERRKASGFPGHEPLED